MMIYLWAHDIFILFRGIIGSIIGKFGGGGIIGRNKKIDTNYRKINISINKLKQANLLT